MSMVDKAVRLGEDMLVARRRQATFESRPLQKAVCVASLVASGGVSGDAHSSVSVMEQDGLSLVASRSELLMLSMHATPLPQLCLDPIVRQTEAQAASLPSTAPIHSVIVDPTAARIFCLHADGRLLAWDGRHGALRNSASILPGTAMALAPPRPLLCVDEESQLVLLDSSWHDHTVRILEPMSLDVHSTVAVGLPGEASGARQVAHMLYVDHVQLVLTSLEGSPCVVGCDGNDGTIRVQLGGHIDSPPALRWLSHPQLLATLGGEGDGLIRLWRLIPLEHPGGPAASVQADGVAAVDAVCERVLRGHAGAVVDAVFLPETNLLVSASVDRTVRFWDAEAAPHPLTAPEGGAHVRVAPGRYESKRPEWTSSNPPYVNCLVINTQEVPLSISALAGWRGPEGLFVLTSGAAADGSTAAPFAPSPPGSGMLALWTVTRAYMTVEAKRFDELVSKQVYSELESTAARDWRSALMQLREAEAGFGENFHAQSRKADAARNYQSMSLLRAASLERSSLSAGVVRTTALESFAVALHEAKVPRAKARLAGDGEQSDTTLTLAQVHYLGREHQLLCAPLSTLQTLRRWLSELRPFAPAAPLSQSGADRRGGKSNGGRLDQSAFLTLLNDLDPLARLRDIACEMKMHSQTITEQQRQLSLRHGSRYADEGRATRCAAHTHTALRALNALRTRLRSHALGCVSRLLDAALPPSESRGNRSRPPPLTISMQTPRPPKYHLDRSRVVPAVSTPSRPVYEACDITTGTCIGWVAVLSRRGAQRQEGRRLADQVGLEVTAARALADECKVYSRCLGVAFCPSPNSPHEEEAHLFFEPIPEGLALPELIATRGWLRASADPSASKGLRKHAACAQILALWGRQLLLAVHVAQRHGILLRTLDLSHIMVSIDGQRLKLGPAALSNHALTDNSLPTGGGRLLSANALPPLEGSLSDALRFDAAPLGASRLATSTRPTAASEKNVAGGVATMRETDLPPELLANELMASAVAGSGAMSARAASTTEAETLSGQVDVWNVGRFLFHAYFGEPPVAYSSAILTHCQCFGLEPRAGAKALLARETRGEPTLGRDEDSLPGTRTAQTDEMPPLDYDPFLRLKRAEAVDPLLAKDTKDAAKDREREAKATCEVQLPSYLLGARTKARPPAGAAPEVVDIIAACLQPRADARPTVSTLLSCKFFALGEAELLPAKREASHFAQLPRASAFVEYHFASALHELHDVSITAGRLLTNAFDELVRKAHLFCTNPRSVLGLPRDIGDDGNEACRELVAQIIDHSDIWGCLRLVCVRSAASGGQTVVGNGPHQGLLTLGRALRDTIAHADIEASFLRPHVMSLCQQLIYLAVGASSVPINAVMSGAWIRAHVRHSTSLMATSRKASRMAAPTEMLGHAASPSELYASLVYRVVGTASPWQYYASHSARCWSPILSSTMQPILAAVLGSSGLGSHSMPALHGALRDAAEGSTGGARRYSKLTSSYCSQVQEAVASLYRIHSTTGQDKPRARIVALTLFEGLLRRGEDAIRLCADIELPQCAFLALCDADEGVRTAAFSVFLSIATLSAGDSGSTVSLDGQACVTTLRACFAQHSVMHCLSRALHDHTEVRAVREKAVQLMGALALSGDHAVHSMMTRTGVWSALAELTVARGEKPPPLHQRAREAFMAAAEKGIPEVLQLVKLRPAMRQRLADSGLPMPAPASLVQYGEFSQAVLVADGGDVTLPDSFPIQVHDADPQVLMHAATCLGQSWASHAGLATAQRRALHALVSIASRRAERSMRMLCAAQGTTADSVEHDLALVLASMEIFRASWTVRTLPIADTARICIESGAAQWLVHAALLHRDPVEEGRPGSDASGRLAKVAPTATKPSDAYLRPVNRVRHVATELVVDLILRDAALPACDDLISRMGIGHAAIDRLHKDQHALMSAIEDGPLVTRAFLEEYPSSRNERLALWNALLCSPNAELARQLSAANAVERLILNGALPFTKALEAPLHGLPAAVGPHVRGMALRNEGLHMLSALLRERHRRPKMYEELVSALQRNRGVQREAMLISRALETGRPSEHEDEVSTSAITLMIIFDGAADLRLWQLMREAAVAEIVHQIHLRAPDAPAAPLARLLEGAHTLRHPLASATSRFMKALHEFETCERRSHPLMMDRFRH